ncbi:MAG: hypothetical protein GY772_23385 [bacterium]|nr:hypothetical protein [bacterium]
MLESLDSTTRIIDGVPVTQTGVFEPDLGVAEVHGLAAAEDDYLLDNYGDDDMLYGLIDTSNMVRVAAQVAGAWAGYQYGPRYGVNPWLGAAGGALAVLGGWSAAEVVKSGQISQLWDDHKMALAGLAGGGVLAWRQAYGQPIPTAVGALAGFALLGGSVRKAIEGGA